MSNTTEVREELVLGMEPDVWYGLTLGFKDRTSNKGVMRLVEWSILGDESDYIQLERIEGVTGPAGGRPLGVSLFTFLINDLRMLAMTHLEREDEYVRTEILPVVRNEEVAKWVAAHIGTRTSGTNAAD